MERLEPLKPTFERDEIEKRINKLYEENGEVNREVTDTATVQDLIYDELRNLNGALASLSAGNEILLKAIVDNTATIADRLGNVRDNTAVMSEHLESANQQLDEITTNALDTVKGVESVDERLVETNNLLTDARDNKPIVEGDYGEPLMTQKDIDAYMESVKDYYVFSDEDKENLNKEYDMSSKTKKVKLRSDERHIIYQALGSRASTLRNQIGYTRVNDDGTLRDQITKHENLIKKLKNS